MTEQETQQEVQPPPASTKSGTALIVLAFAFGGLLALAGLVLPHVPVTNGTSLSDAHGMCHSGLGQFAQALDKEAASDCGKIDLVYNVGRATLVVGVLLLASGAFAVFRRRKRR